MKVMWAVIGALMLVGGVASAEALVNVAGASHIALDGYDAVAFFTDGKPVHGTLDFTTTYHGATYMFASMDHLMRFKADPAHYVPQYGGFCAYGVAVGRLLPVDISTWQVRNEKLYLNLSPDVLKAFNANFEGLVTKADTNWPKLEGAPSH